MKSNAVKLALFSIFTLIVSNSMAQISVGLRESALGNSGAAITESTAPSYYNPALLSEKQKSYFSLTGTTLTSLHSSDDKGEFTSTKFAPNYVSSIQAFDSYIQEFSLMNQASFDSNITTPITNGSQTTNIKNDQYNLAYSFAFRDFPFGFQLGLRIQEQIVHVNKTTNDGNIATGFDFDFAKRTGQLFAGFGGVHQFGSFYRLGYKYETSGINVYKKTDQNGKFYYYDKANNLFNAGDTTAADDDRSFNAQTLSIGHSFFWNGHELLTDSKFSEDPLDKNKYSYYQTFGYKINFDNKMQFMAGYSREFETNANYYSSGYSWVTNTLRSTISAYYAEDGDLMQSAGFTFGSEFVY